MGMLPVVPGNDISPRSLSRLSGEKKGEKSLKAWDMGSFMKKVRSSDISQVENPLSKMLGNRRDSSCNFVDMDKIR